MASPPVFSLRMKRPRPWRAGYPRSGFHQRILFLLNVLEVATRTILAKRIIEMADQGLMDVTELRDDALAFLQRDRSRHGGLTVSDI